MERFDVYGRRLEDTEPDSRAYFVRCSEHRAEVNLLMAERDRLRDELRLVTAPHESVGAVIGALRAERDRLRKAHCRLQQMVDAQALDEGLWFEAETAAEAYLQQELRKLHAVVEAAALEGER